MHTWIATALIYRVGLVCSYVSQASRMTTSVVGCLLPPTTAPRSTKPPSSFHSLHLGSRTIPPFNQFQRCGPGARHNFALVCLREARMLPSHPVNVLAAARFGGTRKKKRHLNFVGRAFVGDPVDKNAWRLQSTTRFCPVKAQLSKG